MQVKAHMAEVDEQVKQGDVTSKGKQKLSDKENNQHPKKKKGQVHLGAASPKEQCNHHHR